MATKFANSSSASQHEVPSAPHKKPRTLADVVAAPGGGYRKKTISLYENALKLMQTGKYEKAHAIFNEMLANAPGDLADRIRMYISACVARMSEGTITFETREERFDYAISLLNHEHYQEARRHFQAILLEKDTADYAFYGLALLASMTGQTKMCIENLTEAIRLNANYRIQARSDSDFDGVADDPRFIDLLYPKRKRTATNPDQPSTRHFPRTR